MKFNPTEYTSYLKSRLDKICLEIGLAEQDYASIEIDVFIEKVNEIYPYQDRIMSQDFIEPETQRLRKVLIMKIINNLYNYKLYAAKINESGI
jgi:hypothetical protein